MKFTDKFTLLTTAIVLSCITLILLGGIFSLRSLSLKYHQQRMDAIVNLIEIQLDKNIDHKALDAWLPDLLKVSGVIRLQLKDHENVLVDNYYENNIAYPDRLLLRFKYPLKRYPRLVLELETIQPYDEVHFSFYPLLGILSAIFLSLSLLFGSVFWIKKHFRGAELLEQRAKYLLQKNPTARIPLAGEWPKYASKALYDLSTQLEESKKQRSHFDAFIRSQVFIDTTTGLANHFAFINRLEIATEDNSVLSSALLIINFKELESVYWSEGETEYHKLLLQISSLLTQFVSPYEDNFLGRFSKYEFVLMIPQVSYSETEILSKRLMKRLFLLYLPDCLDKDCFFHIGVSHFNSGDKPALLIENVERALLVAEHQKASGWFLEDQSILQNSLQKGSIYWGHFLEKVYTEKKVFFYQQQVISARQNKCHYVQLLARICKDDNPLLPPSVFLVMAKKCGFQPQMEKYILTQILGLLTKRGRNSIAIGISISTDILLNRRVFQWFIYELMQLPKALRKKLVLEISEQCMAHHYEDLRKPLVTLQKIGCKIAIDQVGKVVISTQYIIDFNVDYIKIHQSLIRDVQCRKNNQIALQSLVASCLNSRTKVIALGVDNEYEWKYLRKLGIYAGQGEFLSSASSLTNSPSLCVSGVKC
ncbi:regulatory protein CsrD [Psychromonas sp. CNPT3]|uniref:EAL domain-containing protein n=1 Tax=Psychromonas sp. CNPT3 TaxID=314282 RepID=UPI00006E78BF|nr:EAL domain-containing protein [Psychromonas sp. CNPT3]AGH82069.1 regulatory protein CsrD [Psychromonas sp. CNPT3]